MADDNGTLNPEPNPQNAPAPQGGAGAPRLYTQEEVNLERERIRKEVKETLYPEVQNWRQKAEAFEAERRQREEAAAAAEQAAAEKAEQARIAELSAKEQVLEVQRKLEADLAKERQERQALEQIWQKEQQYNSLRLYRQQVLEATKGDIFPEWWDALVGPEGDILSSTEEVDARAASLVARTQSVLTSIQSQMQESQRATPTTSPDAGFARATQGYDPRNDPNINGQSREFTAEEIASWTMADYAKNRQYLPTGRTGGVTNRGLYG
jgi:hypothetical protein